jgi:hypothetical protein
MLNSKQLKMIRTCLDPILNHTMANSSLRLGLGLYPFTDFTHVATKNEYNRALCLGTKFKNEEAF